MLPFKPPYKPLAHAICLLPLAFIAWHTFTAIEPIEALVRSSGDWALRLLLLALAVSPLRRLTRQSWIAQLRRMIGLYAFFYVCLHFTVFVAIDQAFDMDVIIKSILKRPFITVGMAALVLLIPMAITSTNKMIKRLGGKNWQRLHMAIYAIVPLGVLHYYWMVKADHRQPLIYAVICAALLAERIYQRVKRPLAR